MALITRKTNVTLAKSYQANNTVGSGLIAGEALSSGDACYIKASDRRVYKSGGTMANTGVENAQVHGFVLKAAAIGEPVTMYSDVDLAYSAQGAIAGTVSRLWVSAVTAGRLDDTAPAVTGIRPCAFVVGDGMTTETDGGTIHIVPTVY